MNIFLNRNVSITNYIRSHLTSFKIYKIDIFIFYLRILILNFLFFNNYASTLVKIKNKNFPITFCTRYGKIIKANDVFEVSLLLKHFDGINFCNEMIEIDNGYSEPIRLENWKGTVSVQEIFFKKQYEQLNVKDKTVIDIGANIADSAILFARLGAKKIIALEPQPKYFEIGQRNIILNHLDDKIELINAGLSNTKGVFKIKYEESGKGFSFVENKEGIEIPKITLNEIIPQSNNMVLKLDCEFCEYETILNASDEILHKFSRILIEFHDGNKNLIEKLRKVGFNLETLDIRYTFKKKYRGHLLAINNKKN